jgi:hypothetical protein
LINLKRSSGAAILLSSLGLAFSSACTTDATPIADKPGEVTGAGGSSSGTAGTTAGSAGDMTTTDDDASTGGGSSGAGGGGMGTDDASTGPDDATVVYTDSPFMTIDSTFVPDDSDIDPPLEASAPSADGGDAAVPVSHYIRCAASDIRTPSCVGPENQCCYDSDTTTAKCQSGKVACAAGTGTYTCDGPEDCPGTQVCCATVSTKVVIIKGAPHNEYSTACRAASSCPGRLSETGVAYSPACHLGVAGNCEAGTSCQAVANVPYGYGLCLTATR